MCSKCSYIVINSYYQKHVQSRLRRNCERLRSLECDIRPSLEVFEIDRAGVDDGDIEPPARIPTLASSCTDDRGGPVGDSIGDVDVGL
jgi:hypothetical protein